MRIGIDGTCWANDRGYGRYTREIVTAMISLAPGDEFTCFLDAESASRFNLEAANLETIIVDMSDAPTQAAAHDGSRSIRDVLSMSRAASRHALDVFFYPSVYTWFPLLRSTPAVVAIHDVIAERFPGLTLPTRRARLFWNLKVKLALLQSRRVLTVSEFSAADIARVLRIARDRITVAPEAPAAVFVPSGNSADIDAAARKYGLPEGASWFIYVGGFNPHKNVTGIVRAHAEVVRAMGHDAPHLLLVGTLDRDVFHGDRPAIEHAIRESGTGRLVRWTGFVPDEDLRHLNSGAIASLLPSDCEGFGLPAIEAAACGTPSIATTESPLPDILRGGGLFVAPRDHAGLVAAMRLLIDDPALRSELGTVARCRALSLDWNTSAHAVMDAIRRAAA